LTAVCTLKAVKTMNTMIAIPTNAKILRIGFRPADVPGFCAADLSTAAAWQEFGMLAVERTTSFSRQDR
jgi:hypothetical protein